MASNKEMQWRNEGIAYAYNIAKLRGLEALESEIKFRNVTHIPLGVSDKACNEAIERIKNNTLDTVTIMACYVLYEVFGFGHTQIQMFLDAIDREAGNLKSMDDWQRYIDEIAEKTDIRLSIRKNGW